MSFDPTPLLTMAFVQRIILAVVGSSLLASPEILTATTGAILPQWKAIIIQSLGCCFIGYVFGGLIVPLFIVNIAKNAATNKP